MNKNIIIAPLSRLLIIAILMCTHLSINAFPLTTYSDNSVLSEGNWVKISVPSSGVYLITNSNLQKWGFSDPSKVHIYGYGGKRIPDVLSNSNYIDDLPVIQSLKTDKGLVFYGVGPESDTSTEDNYYTKTFNPFTTVGYYFLSDRDLTDIPEITSIGDLIEASDKENATTSFIDCRHHEVELVNHGETGHLLLGEDFKYTPSQTFKFDLPDIDNNQEVWMECQFMTKTFGATSTLSFTVNGETLSSNNTDRISSCSNSAYIHGKLTTTRHSFNISSDQVNIGIKISSSVTLQKANLNYITLNYTRKLKLNNGLLAFKSRSPILAIEGATEATHVWDITTPNKIHSLNTTTSGNSILFKNSLSGNRNYVAWDENGSLPTPSFVGNVANQNLHGLDVPNMIIFTVNEWKSQAERVADLHRNSSDSLKVEVVVQEDVFNEFASGSPDANAFRKMLKMLWDRGNANNTPLQYALFMGKGTFDNRLLTNEVKNLGYPTMPIWQTDKGLDDNESYCTDDVFAFLKDNSGSNMSADTYCIAVGRMPVKSLNEAKKSVDKLYKYINNSHKSEWKNQILLVADDMDNGVHMTQTESMWQLMSNSKWGSQFLYNKLYIDAYTREGNSYPQAKSQMFRLLDEGTLWWNYIGHANTTSWTHDGLFSYTEMSSLYLKKFPFLYAATCEYLRWDGVASSGAEVMYHIPDGGIIGAISAVRPVYIANNGILSNALAPMIFKRNENGKYPTIGEILQNAKNNLYDNGKFIQDRNKLRYTLMGDPAMRLNIPTASIVVSEINGAYVDLGEQTVINARQNAIIKGYITDFNGNHISDFNGIIHSTLYDAEKSTTSHGYTEDDDGKEVIFEEHGSKLYAGRDSVINGEFTIHLSMPTEIANNYREATLNLYAEADNTMEAIGCNRSFFVYGFDNSADPDTIAPVIEYLYVNHEDFDNGDIVNESPMLIAQVSDNVSINLSSAGVGHQMSLRLDGEKNYTDLALYYTPVISNTSTGIINYPIENLPDGNHSLRLKVWDTSGNSTEKNIDFKVINGFAPNIFDVYTDANPAHTDVNFYIKHDRPDAMATISVQVFDLMGKLVWQTTLSGQSDMFISSPINWNLCDMAGRRVNRGIYVYKASISTNGQEFTSAARKLAVAAQ